MSLQGDIRMFWRFASILRFGGERGLPRCVLDEAQDELASIARHTHSSELRAQCETLLETYAEQRQRDMAVVPFWADLAGQLGCCPHCGAQPAGERKPGSFRFFA